MSKSGWGLMVSFLAAAALTITPIPEIWKVSLIFLAWLTTGYAAIGWALAHSTAVCNIRAGTNATHVMTLLLIGLIGGVLAIISWLLIQPRHKSAASQPESNFAARHPSATGVSAKGNLDGEILRLVWHENPDGNATLFLEVQIINNGVPPTIVRGYSVHANLSNGAPIDVMNTMTRLGQQLQTDRYRITIKKLIYEETTAPIADGAQAAGWIAFEFPTPLSQLHRPDTRIILDFHDAKGKAYSVEAPATGTGSEMKYYPGTGTEIEDIASPGPSVEATPPKIEERTASPSEKPTIKKLSWVSESTPSSDDNFPYGLKVTVQTSVPLGPVDFIIECNGEIGRIASWYLGDGGAGMIATNVRQNVQGRRCELSFDSPAVTPQKPLVVVLISASKIAVKDVSSPLR